MLTIPTVPNISLRIPPNVNTWGSIELSYDCAKWVIDNNIKGDFVETGTAAGQQLGAMCLAGERHGWGFDSFEGVPWAGEHDTLQPGIGVKDISKHGILETSGISSYSKEACDYNLNQWGLKDYTLIKGWFQDTLPKWKRKRISVLRLDGDLYESTIVALEYLYPLLSKNGILIIDDWTLPGCMKAFHVYFGGKVFPKFLLQENGTYWQKK